jgi:nitrate reductase gamma subunit
MERLVELRLWLFWREMALVALLAAALAVRYAVALGAGHTAAQESRSAGVLGVLRAGLAFLGQLPVLAQPLLVEGLWHRRLRFADARAWMGHALILVGFLGLGAMSALAALAEHVFRPLGVFSGVVRVALNKDHPVMALGNELLGVALLAGALLRWRSPRVRLRDTIIPGDRPALLLLVLIGASGYAVEALRLLAEAVPLRAARFSFFGFMLSSLLQPLGLNWAHWHFLAFQAHVLAAIALFFYLPFGRLTHIIAGPIVAARAALRARPTR